MAWDRKSRQVLLVMAVTAFASAACSSGSSGSSGDAAPGVVTLASKGSTPTASASAASRPRERLDTTPEEYEAMLVPLDKCIREHGALPKGDWKGTPSEAQIGKLEAASKICEPLYLPLPPWEKDPANPEAKDFARDVVACLKDKGVKYVAVGDNGVDLELGGPQNHMPSIRDGMELIPECERKAAAKK